MNNPLNYTDPFGMIWGRINDSGSPVWYDDDDAMKKAGATAYTPTNNQYEAVSGRWVQLDANSANWNYIDPPSEVNTESSGDINLGSGWTGRLDVFHSGEMFEVHIFDRGGDEQGIVNGRNGWIRKHGHNAEPPTGIPETTLNRINGLNVEELRKRQLIGPKGSENINPNKGGGYLFPGRRIYGAINILGLFDGLVNDAALQKRASTNGRTFNEQQRIELMGQGPYVDSIIGPLPNPYYGQVDQ